MQLKLSKDIYAFIGKTVAAAFSAILLAVLASCGSGGETPVTGTLPGTETAAETEGSAAAVIVGDGSSDYTIIYPDGDREARANATLLSKEIRSVTGVRIPIMSDSLKEDTGDSAKEILVGQTSREAGKAFKKTLKEGQFKIELNGNTLIFAGKNSECTEAAVGWFVGNCVTEGGVVLEEGFKVDSRDVTVPLIEWSGSKWFLDNGGYCRMISLSDGELMAAYSSGTQIYVARSRDNGTNWYRKTKVTNLTKTPNGDSMTCTNANVYEISDGFLIATFRAHTTGSNYSKFYSSIRFSLSRDGGKTWERDGIIAENLYNGSNFTGFWEPHCMTLPDGRLAVYYANDCIGGSAQGYPFVKSKSYQHIIMHIFDDKTETFGATIIASDGEKHNSRDGMPVVCRLSDGGCVMVIESSQESNFPFVIQMLFSSDGIKWSDPVTIYRGMENGDYCGAPYVILLPDGRLAVSCQATRFSGVTVGKKGTYSSTMNVLISKGPVIMDNCGAVSVDSFEKVLVNPLTNGANSYAIWPSMCVHGGYLFCVADLGSVDENATPKGIGLYLRKAKLGLGD